MGSEAALQLKFAEVMPGEFLIDCQQLCQCSRLPHITVRTVNPVARLKYCYSVTVDLQLRQVRTIYAWNLEPLMNLAMPRFTL